MGWISPTSHNDVDDKWTNEANAYDENTSTYASSTFNDYEHWLELILSNTISCDKIRIYCAECYGPGECNSVARIEVYYDAGWHLVFDGEISLNSWAEKAIPAGAKNISKARVYNKYRAPGYTYMRLKEFEFNEIEGASRPLVNGSLAGDGLVNKGLAL